MLKFLFCYDIIFYYVSEIFRNAKEDVGDRIIMKKIEPGLFLDDFEAEARAHIEKIETAFLDIPALSEDPDLINAVFRTAHSLKGTAGFFSLKKIVGVAHELESVFSQVKEGNLILSDEIADIVLQSVDCLKHLIDNIRSEEEIDTQNILDLLKNYSVTEKEEAPPEQLNKMPAFCRDRETEKMLKSSAKRGHKIYYVNINFNRSLDKYYKHPERMLDNILSIGNIVEAIVDFNSENSIRDNDTFALTVKITDELAKRDTSVLDLLITSVLELDLFSIAIEIPKKNIRLVSGKELFNSTAEIIDSVETSEKIDKIEKTIDEISDKPENIKQTTDKNPTPESPVSPVSSVPAAAGSISSANGANSAKGNSFALRLDVSSINGLMDLANEMILTRNQLISTMSSYKKTIAGISPILHDMDRLTSEIQEKVMLMRMQPVNMIFGKFPRIIRDTAKALGKDIEIEIFGNDVTLDKYLLDSLADPITQLVKNSADHGLESAEKRSQLGKPLKGKITLSAHMRDGAAIIEVIDDGAGIDIESLKTKGIERGLVSEETISKMSKKEIFALMFEPGLSTAKQVTNLSGRGVGMDIVKTNIEKLGGSIEIDSEIDKGTTVRLKMPLSLSVISTLIVNIDSIQYAVPEINVERIVRIWKDTPSRRIERVNKSLVLSVNGWIVPVVTMQEIEAKANGKTPPSAKTLLAQCGKKDVVKCLVLKASGKNFALLIDEAIETEETLAKSLPAYLKNCPCYSNVTVLGDGKAITILDAEGIMKFMGIEATIEENEFNNTAEKIMRDEADKKQVIIFKCSGSEYFALETCEIARIEAVDPDNIQEIGEGNFINIAGETIRVIRPEDFVPVKKQDYTDKKLYMLTLKKSESPVGLLVGKVLDKVEETFRFDGDRVYSDFIFGTSVFNEKVLIFLNPAAITEEIEKDKQIHKNIKH